MAMTMAMIAHTLDSSPMESPASTVVAGPVRVASAISRTGLFSVEVKCSVMRLATLARATPMRMAQKTFRSCT
jgi:hypothetical protein